MASSDPFSEKEKDVSKFFTSSPYLLETRTGTKNERKKTIHTNKKLTFDIDDRMFLLNLSRESKATLLNQHLLI